MGTHLAKITGGAEFRRCGGVTSAMRSTELAETVTKKFTTSKRDVSIQAARRRADSIGTAGVVANGFSAWQRRVNPFNHQGPMRYSAA